VADLEAAQEALVERVLVRVSAHERRALVSEIVAQVVEALQGADLSAEEVATIKNVTPFTIRRAAAAGKFPGAMKIGRSSRIPRAALKGAPSDAEVAAMVSEARR
jgi:hypothetical protein